MKTKKKKTTIEKGMIRGEIYFDAKDRYQPKKMKEK